MSGTDGRSLVLVGRFGAAHGVRGELRLISFTQDSRAILSYAPLTDRTGRASFAIVASRPQKEGAFLVRVEGVGDRDAAAALTNMDLYAPRERLPAAAEEEFYIADLIGLATVDPAGAPIGRVAQVLDFGAGQILEIEPAAGGETLLFPFTRAVAPRIDFEAGVIVIVAPTQVEAEVEADVEAEAGGPPDAGAAGRRSLPGG